MSAVGIIGGGCVRLKRGGGGPEHHVGHVSKGMGRVEHELAFMRRRRSHPLPALAPARSPHAGEDATTP